MREEKEEAGSDWIGGVSVDRLRDAATEGIFASPASTCRTHSHLLRRGIYMDKTRDSHAACLESLPHLPHLGARLLSKHRFIRHLR
jgi:hypothetical protein